MPLQLFLRVDCAKNNPSIAAMITNDVPMSSEAPIGEALLKASAISDSPSLSGDATGCLGTWAIGSILG